MPKSHESRLSWRIYGSYNTRLVKLVGGIIPKPLIGSKNRYGFIMFFSFKVLVRLPQITFLIADEVLS